MRYPLFLLVLIFSAMLLSCNNSAEVKRVPLNRLDWKFRQVGQNDWNKATVPGNVISDLKRLNEIPDPFYRFNEDSVQWIEDQDWEYIASFEAEATKDKTKKKLIFHGLDTYADVYLNDTLILQADNMHRNWEVDVTRLIRDDNKLQVYFHAPVKIEKQRLDSLGYLPINVNERAPDAEQTRVFSRKAPFHYGWDWGPRLVTSGIWREVELVTIPKAEISSVFFKPVSVEKELASYIIETTIEADEDLEGTLLIKVNNEEWKKERITIQKGSSRVELPIEIKNPQLWWCHGYGEPHLYNIQIELSAGALLDTYENHLGVRSLKLVQNPDSIGRSFYFELNGIPVFAKGANYIPGETLTTEVDSSRYVEILNDALEANMNMLRVWGGAIYEEDLFYDLCDKKGILIWQDFMFACETTPPTEYMFESIKKEAIDNVIRLRNHPSMALWCGDNENVVGWNTWGWDDIHSDAIDSAIYAGYLRISTEILPKAVAEFHPGIDYWASSPASFPGDQPANRKSGDEHDWTIWFGQKPFEAYGDPTPRFVSEYGVQAFPDMATIEAFARESDMGLDTKVMNHRQRSDFSWLRPGMNGNDMILQYIDLYFDEPKDFESIVYLSQLMQARALKTGIEMHRRVKPYCMGSLYWQINDCWPTVSWASVDYFGRWKSSHYRVRDAFKPYLIVPEWKEDQLVVDLVSDNTEETSLQLSVFEFPVLNKGNLSELWNAEVKPVFDQAIRLDDFAIQHNPGMGLYFELKNGEELLAENILLPEKPKNIIFSNPEISIKTSRVESGKWKIEVKSPNYAHGVFLEASVPGKWSDNYFHLPAGKVKTVVFEQKESSAAPEFRVTNYLDYVK